MIIQAPPKNKEPYRIPAIHAFTGPADSPTTDESITGILQSEGRTGSENRADQNQNEIDRRRTASATIRCLPHQKLDDRYPTFSASDRGEIA